METTQVLLHELHMTLCEQYVKQIEALPFKPRIREAIIDGYRDGCRQGIHHTVKMLGVVVK